MKMQELAGEFLQYREQNNQNNQRIEQLLISMEARFQELQSNFKEILPQIVRSSAESSSKPDPPPHIRVSQNASWSTDDPRHVLKFVKPEIPKFDGKEPNSWIFKAELFFKIQQVPEQMRVELAGLRMEGVATDWFQWIFNGGTVQSWEEFVRAVRERFGPSNYKDVRGVLAKLLQKGSLADYMAEFQRLVNQVSNVSDDLLMTFFVAGLQPDIQGAVQIRWPSSLHQAMQLAIAYDSHHGELRSSISNQPKKFFSKPYTASTVDKPPALPATTELPIKKMSPDALQKRRDLGLCYTCDEKWNSKHRCKAKMLLLIVDEEEPDREMDEEILWRKEETPGSRVDAALHSLSGKIDARSLILLVMVGTREVQVLVDSGSSHCFIRRQLAEELSLPMVKATRMRVFMGNGEFLSCEKKCPQVKLQVQGHCFAVDLFVVDLCDLNIVLGMKWLITLGRVTHNYAEQSMEFTWNKKLILLDGLKTNSRQITEDSKGGDLHLLETSCHALSVPELHNIDSQVLSDLHLLKDKIPALVWKILFSWQLVFDIPKSLPPFRDRAHAIQLLDDSHLVKVKPYRYPYHHKAEIEKQVGELLSVGWIQQSHSAFSSPVLLVKKHDNTWRMCVDYRALNSMTVKDAFPIPTIDELLDELYHARIFSKLDLRSGYHQIRMQPEDIHKTAFRTHEGHYEFKVMPFGLTNAPATFQAAMNRIFRPYMRKFIVVFFDDMLIYSPSLEEHVTHLETALKCLLHNSFYVKLSKCAFGVEELSYLGHVVTACGVKADPKKIEAMLDWPIPQSIKQLRAFLGLTGYYRRFVKGYAAIAHPLTELLKQDKIHWSKEAAVAFTALKEAMASTPILQLPDFSSPFIVESNASNVGIGAVLLQRGKPISFFSKKLGPRMAASFAYVRELYALT
ncbi:uncharacterized protein LOC133289704 [Gastrolobium bilobum]|uniref:uncharacterized protein LOC133289704 n=1 Tax=Gastrolobium bilobum TaxID=150636 RepID=UPI002AB0D60D|nr:uncharacterized protein LOC133289704 [Gastrolobium bilobum]